MSAVRLARTRATCFHRSSALPFDAGVAADATAVLRPAGIADNRALIARLPTHGQLASRIGTHREAVTREMQYLQKAGIVEQRGRALAVGNVARLAEIVRAAAGDVDILQRAKLARR